MAAPKKSPELDFSTVSLEQVQKDPGILLRIGDSALSHIREAHRENPAYLRDLDGSPASYKRASWQVKQSGIWRPLNRNLWTPRKRAPIAAPIVIAGGSATAQERVLSIIEKRHGKDKKGSREVYSFAGGFAMKSDEDIFHPNVGKFSRRFGRNPTEIEYAEEFIYPRLEKLGYDVSYFYSNRDTRAGIIEEAVEEGDIGDLLDGPLTVVDVAGVGLTVALELRKAGRQAKPDFDDAGSPQVHVLTDASKVASKREQTSFTPDGYRPPQLAIRHMLGAAQAFRANT